MFVPSYIIFAIANKAEEQRPWAKLINSAPSYPHVFLDKIPAVTRPICPTEEYAIRDLISGCRRQIILVITAPHIEIEEIRGIKGRFIFIKGEERRRSPYLPSFNKTPARIIDPATGASTWALGSHK